MPRSRPIDTCRRCGVSTIDNTYPSIMGAYCKACFNRLQSERFQQTKQRIVDHMGGKCSVCGYDRYIGALQIHHTDPSKKDPKATNIRMWKWERVLKEIEHCVLLCANCHAETHALTT